MAHETIHVKADSQTVRKLKLDQQVRVELVGKVVELEAERELDYGPGDSETMPASFMLEVTSRKVEAADNEFTELYRASEED